MKKEPMKPTCTPDTAKDTIIENLRAATVALHQAEMEVAARREVYQKALAAFHTDAVAEAAR